jgi:hypothetical protein
VLDISGVGNRKVLAKGFATAQEAEEWGNAQNG